MSSEVHNAVAQELTVKADVALRRCPFCNGTQLRAVRGMTESGDLGAFNIECATCQGAGPPGGSLEEAANRWNMRL